MKKEHKVFTGEELTDEQREDIAEMERLDKKDRMDVLKGSIFGIWFMVTFILGCSLWAVAIIWSFLQLYNTFI